MAHTRVAASGSTTAKVLVVGDAPDQRSIEMGSSFSGPAGEMVKRILYANGVSSVKDVRFANLIQQRPPGLDMKNLFYPKGNKVLPTSQLILEGLTALKAEIQSLQPNLIVSMGNYALWALTGKHKTLRGIPSGVSDWRGSIIEGSDFALNKKVLVTQDPAYIQKVYKDLPLLESDLSKVKKEMQFPNIRRRPRNIILNPEGHEREVIIQQLLDAREPIAFDIEYIPASDRWICISFSIHPEWAVSWAIKGGGDVNDARRVLLSGRPLCAQNGMFDCAMLEHWYGIACMQYLAFDTMLASHAAYIELPKDLGTLCSLYTDQPCYWTTLERGHWKAMPDASWTEKTMRYNAIDAYVTCEVMQQLEADELRDPKIRKTFDFEMSLVNPLWKMSKRGVRIDLQAMEAFRTDLNQKETTLAAELKQITDRTVNVKSGLQITKLLYGPASKYQLTVTSFTDKGAPATDDRALVKSAQGVSASPSQVVSQPGEEVRRVIDIIREIREYKDLKSKFLDIKLDTDKRIRCHYNPGGTVTGRLASRKFFPTGSGGNLQNIPREKKIRRLFVPDPGKTFFYNDLKSAESHVVAYLTGDPLMIELHQPGMKPHEITASLLFDIPLEDVIAKGKDSVERYLGKQTRHACNYSMGWSKFQENINAKGMETGVYLDAATAKKIVYKYRQIHPFLETWWRSIELQLNVSRKLYTLLDRPRRFFDRLGAVLPTAIAYVPQGTVGDVVNMGLVLAENDEELKDYGFEMLLQVHDAIGGQANTEYIMPAMRRFKQLMAIPLFSPTTATEFTIPLDVSIGPNWADVEEVEV